MILDSSFYSSSYSISSLREEAGDEPDIQIYVLAEAEEDGKLSIGPVIVAGGILASARKTGMIPSPMLMIAINLLISKDGLVHVKFVANSFRCIKYSHSIHRDGNGGCR
ncbi:hypothetical protein SDJN03_01598, partial [Cucurbita argyrosperma subsp. sororia]